MKKIPYWIQNVDYSSKDYDPVHLDQAKTAVRSHDWAGQLEQAKEMEDKNEDWCPPGIGFTKGNGGILHICAQKGGSMFLYYHYNASNKLLGFIPTSKQVIAANMDISIQDAEKALTCFFTEDHDGLLGMTTEQA